jgi:hypothetical protein
MKKLFSILVVLVLFSSCAATKKPVGYKDFYKANKNKENVVSFGLPTGLIGLFIDKKEDKELKEFLKNVDKLRFFIADDSTKVLYPVLEKFLPEELYKDYMVINDGGNKVVFKAREGKNSIEEIIMLVEEESSFVVMSIEGEFTYKDLSKFAKTVDVNKVVDAEDD